MAEGTSTEIHRRLSDLDLSQLTKEDAIKNLQNIQNHPMTDNQLKQEANNLQKVIEENGQGLGEILCSQNKKELCKFFEKCRTVETLAKFFGQSVSLFASRQDDVMAIQDNLDRTRRRLQDAMDKINVLNQELQQVRLQQRKERNEFEAEISHIKEEKTRQQRGFEDEIRDLRSTIRTLEQDKEALQREIRELRTKLEEEQAAIEKFKQDQRETVEKLSETSMKEIGRHQHELDDIKTSVQELKEENKKLKTRDPYKLVGFGVTLMANALYKYVHNVDRLRKNYYPIATLQSHLTTRYGSDEEGHNDAQRRWNEMKRTIGWDDNAKDLVDELAEYRERGANTMNVSISYPEFSEAVRMMYTENELENSEAELIRDLFSKCLRNLPMEHTRRD